MFGNLKLAELFPVPPDSVVGKGFVVEGELMGVHSLTTEPPTVAVFIRGRNGSTYMARFSQTAPMSVQIAFSAEPDFTEPVNALADLPPR